MKTNKRVRLIHWKPEEAEEKAVLLRRAGYAVEVGRVSGPEDLKTLRQLPPDVFLIDLTRLPSQGRDVALALRQYKGTRWVPIVFLDGEPDKVERLKRALPDAMYSSWADVASSIEHAIEHPVQNPVAPDVMAGYSGTPLVKKLGVKANFGVALLGAPDGFEDVLRPLPDAVRFNRKSAEGADLVVWFVRSADELRRGLPTLAAGLGKTGLWICWPKKASGVRTDLSETVVRGEGLAVGLVDFKISAIDATWSGLKFVRRK